MSIHFHKLAIKDVRRETPDCISVAFELPDELKSLFQYQPGQNVTVKTLVNDKEVRRSYSICSGLHENELRIAIKEATGGVFSGWANRVLIKGHSLDVLPPTGRFIVNPNNQNRKKYLAIAAGSGITPIISIISSVLQQEPESSFTLLYGNRNRASIIFRDRLDALKNRFISRFALHHVLSREITDAEIYSGRITSLKCEEMSASLIEFQSMDEIFLCGPEAMVFEIRNWLLARKIPPNKIHYELFTIPLSTGKDEGGKELLKKNQPGKNQVSIDQSGKDQHLQDLTTMATPKSVAAQDENYSANEIREPIENITPRVSGMGAPALPEIKNTQVSNVTVKLDGTSFNFKLPFEGPTILEAALELGADLPFSCKGGVCSTCRAKLLEGKVAMDLNYALEPEEVEAGFILCCQAHPLTSEVVVDFDER